MKTTHQKNKDEKTIIDLQLPTGWSDLSDKQLRYVFKLMVGDFNSDEIKMFCLLKWGKIQVVGKLNNGAFLLKKGKSFFERNSLQLSELLSNLDWLTSLPSYPVRLSKIGRRRAVSADFSGVPFEKYIIADNLYQGYLVTRDEILLKSIAEELYGQVGNLKPEENLSIFFWVASLKDFFAKKFSDFFSPSSSSDNDGNLLGSTSSVEEAMNAQIRALTKGDISKEKEILSLDTWRALTELNAQAKEYKELNAKIKSK